MFAVGAQVYTMPRGRPNAKAKAAAAKAKAAAAKLKSNDGIDISKGMKIELPEMTGRDEYKPWLFLLTSSLRRHGILDTVEEQRKNADLIVDDDTKKKLDTAAELVNKSIKLPVLTTVAESQCDTVAKVMNLFAQMHDSGGEIRESLQLEDFDELNFSYAETELDVWFTAKKTLLEKCSTLVPAGPPQNSRLKKLLIDTMVDIPGLDSAATTARGNATTYDELLTTIRAHILANKLYKPTKTDGGAASDTTSGQTHVLNQASAETPSHAPPAPHLPNPMTLTPADKNWIRQIVNKPAPHAGPEKCQLCFNVGHTAIACPQYGQNSNSASSSGTQNFRPPRGGKDNKGKGKKGKGKPAGGNTMKNWKWVKKSTFKKGDGKGGKRY